MKPAGWLTLFLLTLVWPSGYIVAQTVPHRCAATVYDSVLRAHNPAYHRSRERFEQKMLAYKRSGRTARQQTGPLTIPVVVHVIHLNQSGTIGGNRNSNISDEQIREQIRVLNEDFRRKPGTRGFNTDPVGADININFVLTDTDPTGRLTTGITRHLSRKASYNPFDQGDRTELARIVNWPTHRYLNIWVAPLSGTAIGYAQFPDDSDLDGLNGNNGFANTDGVIVNYKAFGEGPNVESQIYNQGRTTTHEIGHWLGLLHTFGEEGIRCDDDFVDDTPIVALPNNTNDLSCPAVFSTCNGLRTRNMIENYMDYSPDTCMNIFTEGQKERVWQALELSPRRRQLVEYWQNARSLPASSTLIVRNIKSNPLGDDRNLRLEVLLEGSQDVYIDIIDRLGRTIQTEIYPHIPSKELGLSLQSLASGVYIVRVRTATETQIRKLVVQ